MPLSRLQYRGGAHECRWQETSPRDGRDRGAVSSLLGVVGVVLEPLDLLQPPSEIAVNTMAMTRTGTCVRVPRMCER